jgi:hypothetical protein
VIEDVSPLDREVLLEGVEKVSGVPIRVPIDWPSLGETCGVRFGAVSGLSLGDVWGLSCGDVCGLRVGDVCERELLKGGNLLIVTGVRGVLTLGLLDTDGVRTVGLRKEKLLRRFSDGLRLIRDGVRLICGADRDGLLMRGELTEGRELDMRGAEGRGAGVEGRLGAGADRAAALLAALSAAGPRGEDCPCVEVARSKPVATATAATDVLKQVFFFRAYIVESPFPGGFSLRPSGISLPVLPPVRYRPTG